MFHRSFASMNTRLSIVLPSVDALGGERLAGELMALLRDQEATMSRFDPNAELARVNRHAAHRAVELSESLWTVIDACRRYHRVTRGAFDIAQGGRKPGHGMHQLEVDATARTVRFHHPDLRLDLGGIGKGIALDAIRQHLKERQVAPAFLSFGESSVAVVGSHPAGDCWPVGVEHLFQPAKALHEFRLRDASMSTSGNRPGQAHIVNPSSGQLVVGCRTVSVACSSAADAEALSTALFILPEEQGAAVLRDFSGATAVAHSYANHGGHWTVESSWQYEH